MNKFVIEDRGFRETDLIIEILQQERIPYKLKSKKTEGAFNPVHVYGYDIWLFTDYEHFLWAKKLINEKICNLNKLEKIYEAPSVNRKGQRILDGEPIIRVVVKKPIKKSILKRFVDWVGEHV